MGLPAFEGYYITHDWEEGTMSFVPHKDSIRSELKSRLGVIEKEFMVKMQSENVEDAEVISIVVASVLSLLCLAGTGLVVYATIVDNTGNG